MVCMNWNFITFLLRKYSIDCVCSSIAEKGIQHSWTSYTIVALPTLVRAMH